MKRVIGLLEETEPVDLDDDLESEYDIGVLIARAHAEGREYRGMLYRARSQVELLKNRHFNTKGQRVKGSKV